MLFSLSDTVLNGLEITGKIYAKQVQTISRVSKAAHKYIAFSHIFGHQQSRISLPRITGTKYAVDTYRVITGEYILSEVSKNIAVL